MSSNDGPRIESLSSMVGGRTPTTPQKASSAADEKGAFDHDVDSIYDEEEIPETRESDFKQKQVRLNTDHVKHQTLTKTPDFQRLELVIVSNISQTTRELPLTISAV